MQDQDLFDGVVGKYTGRFDENGIKKTDDMEITSKLSVPHCPRKFSRMFSKTLLLLLFSDLVHTTKQIMYFHMCKSGCVYVQLAWGIVICR